MGIRDITERALRNIGFPLEERTATEQSFLADSLSGLAKEDKRKKRSRLSISETHEVVYGCIRAISSACAEMPVVLHKDDTIIEDREDKVWQLVEFPNETMGRPQLMTAIVWSLMASGNSFVEIVFYGRHPVELWPITADSVDIVVGTDKRIDGYIVNIGQEKIRLQPEQVWHNKLFHPRDGYHGLSPITALEQGVLADIESVNYSKTLYENLAVPLGILKSEQEVTPKQAREIIAQWNEQLRGGAGSVALLGRSIDWKPITISPKDVYYIQSRNLTRRQVQTVYGCSDLFLGEAGAMPFAGSVSAIRVFYENTIFPLLSQIQYTFNNHVLQWFPGYWIEFDRNRVPFLLEMLRERAKTHADLLRAGVPQKDIWPLVWQKPCPLDDKIASISYVPVDIIPAGTWNQSVAGPNPELVKQTVLSTRKDETMEEIMHEIQRLNNKLEQIRRAGES